MLRVAKGPAKLVPEPPPCAGARWAKRMADDLGREAMAAVAERPLVHQPTLALTDSS